MAYSREFREKVLNLVRGGVTVTDAAREVGVARYSLTCWCAAAGIRARGGRRRKGGPAMPDITAAERPARRPGARMGPWERVAIQEGIRAGRSFRSISEGIGFSHTSVSREVARGSEGGVYDARRAQERAEREAARPRARKLDADPGLRGYVVEKLDSGWSPRQISGRIGADFPGDGSMRVSHETIYQALYVQGKGSLREELSCEQALRSGRTRRRPRSKLPARPGRGWVEGCEISERPPEAEDRAVPGHWEGDLVIGGDMRSCLVTLVERKTRYLEMRALPAHDTRTVVDLLIEMVAEVPESVRSSVMSTLTWDQGVELADHARFTEATGFKVYFCDPHSPWQKGTNENTNGLIRQFLPKGTEFADIDPGEVRRVQGLLNSRPRETLGWRTPAEALAQVLSEADQPVH